MSRVAQTWDRLRARTLSWTTAPEGPAEPEDHDAGVDPDLARRPPRPRRVAPASPVVVDELSARREMRDGEGNLACSCGNVWWRSPAVTISSKTGQVSGHAHPLTCIECGAPAPSPVGSAAP